VEGKGGNQGFIASHDTVREEGRRRRQYGGHKKG
jgi:hypothetical protein